MAGAAATRVLADDAIDLDVLRAELDGTGARVEAAGAAPAGDDVVGLVSWERPVGDPELARLPALRVLVTPSVGFDHIDLDAARRHGGTWVCHVPDYCVDEMAWAFDPALTAPELEAEGVRPAGLVDTAAMLDALETGRLGGAALDVLDVEPPTPAHPAPQAPNLIATPRIAYASAEADTELQRRVGAAIRAVLEGRAPAGALVTPSRP